MAILNITTNGYGNLPPTRVGDKTLNLTYNQTYVFTLSDFTSGTIPTYSDPEGDSAYLVKILTVPLKGVLYWFANPVIANDEIPVADIVAGNLTYVADVTDLSGYTNYELTFNVADSGSLTYGSITPGEFTIIVGAKQNLPPSQVGDVTIPLSYGETHVFTRANLTTETTPVYADPEGDAVLNVKILSLPATGNLKINSVPAVVNQVVPFTTIDSGFFTYVPNISITDAQTLTFDFSISDVGSGQYTV